MFSLNSVSMSSLLCLTSSPSLPLAMQSDNRCLVSGLYGGFVSDFLMQPRLAQVKVFSLNNRDRRNLAPIIETVRENMSA